MLEGNLEWTCVPSRGSRNSPGCFISWKPKISMISADEPFDCGRLDLAFLHAVLTQELSIEHLSNLSIIIVKCALTCIAFFSYINMVKSLVIRN